MERLLLKVNEAASVVGCSRSTAYELIKRGEWPTVTTPYGLRVLAQGLREWVERQPQESGR